MNVNATVRTDLSLVGQDCNRCGAVFGVLESFDRNRREQGGEFYCPNGHPLHYGESKVRMLEKQFARERAARDQAQAEARENGAKLSKLQARISDGVCPCCPSHIPTARSPHEETP
jgi:hypothetical protein